MAALLHSIWLLIHPFVTPSLIAFIGWVGKRKLGEIHVLVNGRMSDALREIAELKRRWAARFPEDETAQADAKKAELDIKPLQIKLIRVK